DTNSLFAAYTLDFTTPLDPALQEKLETLDARLREHYGMATNQTAVGVLDLKRLRLAMLHPDRIEYAASVPKLGILLAWFQLHPGLRSIRATTQGPTASDLSPAIGPSHDAAPEDGRRRDSADEAETRHELGLMIKVSSTEM